MSSTLEQCLIEAMHKDPKPGLFDFAGHSIRYTISLGLTIGFALSVLGCGAFFIWRADSGMGGSRQLSTAELESQMAARRKGTPTPAPTASMHY